MKADRWLRHLAVVGVVAFVGGHVWMEHVQAEADQRETERVGRVVEEAERKILGFAEETNPDLAATLRMERDRRIVAEKRIQKLRQMVTALQVSLQLERATAWRRCENRGEEVVAQADGE